MENKEVKNVPDIPYIAFESSQARMERVNKKLWIVILVLIVALVGSNAAWIFYESQWQYVQSSTEVSQELDADNGDAIINDGVHINEQGTSNSKINNNN